MSAHLSFDDSGNNASCELMEQAVLDAVRQIAVDEDRANEGATLGIYLLTHSMGSLEVLGLAYSATVSEWASQVRERKDLCSIVIFLCSPRTTSSLSLSLSLSLFLSLLLLLLIIIIILLLLLLLSTTTN